MGHLEKSVFCVAVFACLFSLCLANEDGPVEGAARQQRFFGGFFNSGPAPLPGDTTSPIVCERFCRNRCLNGGYSGYLAYPFGCTQYCDCSYYLGGPGFFG